LQSFRTPRSGDPESRGVLLRRFRVHASHAPE
jgi:hypothetical protein